jgi:general secretion pathway protein I
MKATAISRKGGFTLLEIMIALAIVSIALVTLLSLGNRSIAVHDRLEKITRATLLAQDKMTEVEVTSRQTGKDLENEEGVFDKPFDGFRWRTTFTDTPLPSIKQVTVTVLWGDEKRNQKVDLTSFVTD